ncbi:MAG: hypothetical protein HKN25_13890 [Pyrinomonadaceae bacterium]|nr:hypothetical protein [Pyrinomonadaceae bacterium]
MRAAIIASKENAITTELQKELTGKGVEVRLLYPQKQLTDLSKLCVEDDLYILQSVEHLGLGLVGALHAAGANTLNPYPAVAQIKHKVVVTQILHSAGVPVPETYTTTEPDSLLNLLKQNTLIAKPFDGNRGRGIQILSTPNELQNVDFGEFLMVQRYYEPDEPERFIKAYFLDGRIFFRKRRWSISGPNSKESEPVDASAALTNIVSKCAQVLDLKLFGLDIVISREKPYVVDVQEFGSFAGVPDASRLLADFIFGHLEAVLETGTNEPTVNTVK